MQVTRYDVTLVEVTPVRRVSGSKHFLVRELKVHAPNGDLTVTLYSIYDGAPENLWLVNSEEAPKDSA